MILDRNKLYALIITACIAGYIWFYYILLNGNLLGEQLEVCIIKRLTEIPCPSCGSTRAILSLAKGEFIQSLKWNPLGILSASIMLTSPVWILADVISRGKSFYRFYHKLEMLLKKPAYAIPSALLILINWIWIIIKGN